MIQRIIAIGAMILFCAQADAQDLWMSVQSGNWSTAATWDCNCIPGPNDHVIVVSGHLVPLSSATNITNLTIEEGATVFDNGLAITISGNLLLNGTYSGSGVIHLTGDQATIDGSGLVSTPGDIQISDNKVILASASLTINSSNIVLTGAYTITNHGTITVGGNITGLVEASTWINEVNSTLNIGGSSGAPLLATGTLHASAPGNTINYYATYAHTIKLPGSVLGYSTYHHLKISGSNTKTMPNGDVAVNGDLTINSTLSGSGSGKKIFLRGNWINYGNYTEGTGASTITFDGTSDQFVFRASKENMNVVVVNKPSGKLILNTDVIAERGLTMIAGDIDVNSNTLTLGLSSSVVGILSWTSGIIIGKFERWIADTGVPILFPIGTASDYRPASILFNSLTPGSLITEFIASSPGNNGMPLVENGVTLHNTFRDGYWSLTAANSLDTLNFDLELTGNGFTGFLINDNTRLLTRASSLSPWIFHGSHMDRIGNMVRRTNLSVLSGQYCFGDDTDCLAPITSPIAGITDVCKNEAGVVYAVTNTFPNTYSWTADGGAILSGNGTNSIIVNWGSAGLQGSVSVIESNTCTQGVEVTQKVNVHALPTAAISGKISVPENGVIPEMYSVTLQPDYTYTWTVTGGTIASGQDTNSITVNWGDSGSGTVCVTAHHSPGSPVASCGQSVQVCNSISIYKVINSIRSGNWQTSANWDCACVPGLADNVTIRNTHTISLTNDRSVNHLTILAGGAINTNSNLLTIQGNLSVNGSFRGAGPVELAGLSSHIDGAGIISNTGPLTITSHKEILPHATLTKRNGTVTLSSGVVVTNHGTITLGGSLIGIDENSEWINAANSTLNIGGELLPIGKLYASSGGNTIHYFGNDSQEIALPNAGQYAHLSISGTGIKSAPVEVLRISGDFTNDGNFQHNHGSVEFNGNSRLSGTAITTFNHLSLPSGSSLTFPVTSVNVEGNINFNPGSRFDPAGGTIILNGMTAQQVDVQGASFHTLLISKTGGTVDVNSPVSLLHLLQIQTATTIHSNGNLIITSRGSTTEEDASIGVIPAGASIDGNVNVQRNLPSIGKVNRYLSSPVKGVTSGQLRDDFSITGGSIRFYDETVAGPLGNGYSNFNLNGGVLQSGRGYLAWMYDGVNDKVWDVEGEINQGEVSLPVSFTSSVDQENDGWNLVGNPYPSSILWNNSAGWSRRNIDAIIYVPDLSIIGYPSYFHVYNYFTGAGDLPGGEIAMGQAFWVHANNSTPELIIREDAKTSAGNGRFYRQREDEFKHLVISIRDGKFEDKSFLVIHAGATQGFDPLYDGFKFRNELINVFWIDDADRSLVMHSLTEIGKDDSIRIGLQVAKPGRYRLSFSGVTKVEYDDLYLIDRFDHQRWLITDESFYEFEIMDSSHPIPDRFYITRSREGVHETRYDTFEVFPNPVKDVLHIYLPESPTASLTLFDQLGNICWSGKNLVTHEINMSQYADGIFFLQIEVMGRVETIKVVKY